MTYKTHPQDVVFFYDEIAILIEEKHCRTDKGCVQHIHLSFSHMRYLQTTIIICSLVRLLVTINANILLKNCFF